MSVANTFTSLVAVALLASFQPAGAATVSWNGWTFDHEVSGKYDGLSLSNVSYRGRTLLRKISLPVMRVFYQGNACGPYADRLGGTLSPIPWSNNAVLAQREFTLNGRQWYEIGIRDRLGNYDIYQAYYLSAEGVLDAHIYSKGLQCRVDHVHYPNWRIDFDVDGSASNVIEHATPTGYQADAIEFDASAATAVDHGWRVRNSITNLHVDILPGFADFTIPDGSTTSPITEFQQNTVFGRAYRASEDTGWVYGPNSQVPHNNGESIQDQDLLVWYEAYMPHAASAGSALWHSTGLRLVSNLTDSSPPTQPMGLSATAVSSSQANLSWIGSTDDVGVVSYAVERCLGSGCTNFQGVATAVGTSAIDTRLSGGTTYRYRVRASDAVGNASVPSNVAEVTTPAAPQQCTVSRRFASVADDKVVYQLTDTSPTAVRLDSLALDFPISYVSVKEVKLGGTVLFKSSASVPAVPSGVPIDSWTNTDPAKRQVSPGSAKNLEISFSKKSPKSNCPNGSCFSGTASFAPGCQVGLGP